MIRFSTILMLLICFAHKNLSAQADFYDEGSIQEIRLYFEEANWDHILDSLYVDGMEERLVATVVINGTQLDSVGVRYKGYSSVSTNRVKNPFNIKLNYIIGGQRYDGIDKIKLSNVIQDPSFVREVLSYEIGRKYMPASRANYANLYINDTLWGLYTNVEAVGNEFLQNHFNSSANTFFKCNPDNLDLNGENSNLGNSPGTDPLDYDGLYDLKSESGWDDLYALIDTLNEVPDSIHHLLNVDRTLWMHAFNYALINFDSYVGYAQNYYLYQDHNGQFNPILWDLNMSFASYRMTDASLHYSGFSIQEAKEMDPLLHYNSVSVFPRPLMRNLFENDRYRKMYIAHLRTIMEENVANQEYANRAQDLQNLISTSVIADTNKFYTDADFFNNLTSTVSDLIDYPGIIDLMDDRWNYLSTYPGMQGAPTISNVAPSTQNINLGDDIWISATVADADEVFLAYRFGESEVFKTISMFDDGNHNDGTAGDSLYGAELTDIGNVVEYYIYAENDSTGRFSPERAAYEFYSIESKIGPQDLVINEFMAVNDTYVSDDEGDYDDWIELYNNTQYPISTKGLYLSDDYNNLTAWEMPNVVIEPDSYLMVWADEDTLDSGLHTNFKIASNADSLVLSYDDGTVIDSVSFGTQHADISTGRIPNGTGSFILLVPTYGANNEHAGVEDLTEQLDFSIYPNPAGDMFNIRVMEDGPYEVQILDINGKVLTHSDQITHNGIIPMTTSNFAGGIYFVKLSNENSIATKKVIIN